MTEEAERRTIVLGLVDEYYDRVLCFARRSLSRDEADDVVQEAFLRIMRLKNLQRGAISVSYLIKVADNLIKGDYLRRRRFRRYMERMRPGLPGAPETHHIRPAEINDVEQRLRRLSAPERDALRLIVCEDLSYDEAARCLGVPVSTVNNWKHRGLRKLRRDLKVGASEARHGRGAADGRPAAKLPPRRETAPVRVAG